MSDQVAGYLDPTDTASDTNRDEFVISSLIGRIATITVAKVLAVTNSGGVSAVGFVDVQPMVHQADPNGKPTPHGTINHLPYVRVQGGTSAVIIDPKVGDIGLVGFCSRDISAVKRQKAPAAPGSRRQHDWADGIYIGGLLNGVPNEYIRFSSTGVDIVTPHHLTITSDNATLDASGNFVVKGEVTAKSGGSQVTLSQHHHSGVTSGIGTSGAPVPGT